MAGKYSQEYLKVTCSGCPTPLEMQILVCREFGITIPRDLRAAKKAEYELFMREAATLRKRKKA